MRNAVLRGLLSVFAALAAAGASPVAATWSSDATSNLAVADGSGDQVLPLVGSTSDGGLWLGWFDNRSGAYRVYVQRLDAAGREQFAHNGLLVSAHPQNTALFGWDLIVDTEDHCVLVFSDTRDGGDLDIHAYRIAPDGTLVWGADGVTLSSNPDFEPAPRVTQAANGEFVFVWQRDPASGDGDIRMQRLTAAGAALLAPGGLAVVASAGEDPGFVSIVPSSGGDVILLWLRDIRSFASSRHVRARRFAPDGAPVWGAHVSVYDAFSVPIGYFPKIEADGNGGAFVVWHRSDGSFFNSFVQHLDGDGLELFPHNGVAVSTVATMHHIDPTFARDSATGEVIVAWNERVSNQSQWGILAQRFATDGSRLWGPGGLTLLPVNTTFKSSPRAVAWDGGAIVVFTDQPAGSDRLVALRLDAAGGLVWGGSPLVLSSVSSAKSRLPVTIDSGGSLKVAWEDNRSATQDVYAQNVTAAGLLGLSPFAGEVDASLRLSKLADVVGNLTLSWAASCSNGALDYGIFEGSLGDWTSHGAIDCSDGGSDLREEIQPGLGDTYYLVVPLRTGDEGSYGTDSSATERPQAAAGLRCLDPQVLGTCD